MFNNNFKKADQRLSVTKDEVQAVYKKHIETKHTKVCKIYSIMSPSKKQPKGSISMSFLNMEYGTVLKSSRLLLHYGWGWYPYFITFCLSWVYTYFPRSCNDIILDIFPESKAWDKPAHGAGYWDNRILQDVIHTILSLFISELSPGRCRIFELL